MKIFSIYTKLANGHFVPFQHRTIPSCPRGAARLSPSLSEAHLAWEQHGKHCASKQEERLEVSDTELLGHFFGHCEL